MLQHASKPCRPPLGAAALAVLALSGCASPWQEAAQREAPWWGPAEALESAAGLDLVALPAGEPLGYWPRVVVRPDGIDFDDRAWALSLPAEALQALSEAERGALLFEESQAQVLQAGRSRPEDQRGLLLEPLSARLEERREALRAVVEAHELDYPSTVVLVVDAAVPWSTAQAVLYTTVNGLYASSYTFAGVHEGRLRGALGSRPHWEPCSRSLVTPVTGDGVQLPLAGLPHLGGADGACSLEPARAAATLRAFQERCVPRWQAAIERAQQARGARGEAEGTLPEDTDWQCVEAWPAPVGDPDMQALLPAVATLLAAAPQVALGPLVGTDDTVAACLGTVDPAVATEAQLDLLCGVEAVQAHWEVAFGPDDPHGLYGRRPEARGLPGRASSVDPDHLARVAQAFPEYAARVAAAQDAP